MALSLGNVRVSKRNTEIETKKSHVECFDAINIALEDVKHRSKIKILFHVNCG